MISRSMILGFTPFRPTTPANKNRSPGTPIDYPSEQKSFAGDPDSRKNKYASRVRHPQQRSDCRVLPQWGWKDCLLVLRQGQ